MPQSHRSARPNRPNRPNRFVAACLLAVVTQVAVTSCGDAEETGSTTLPSTSAPSTSTPAASVTVTAPTTLPATTRPATTIPPTPVPPPTTTDQPPAEFPFTADTVEVASAYLAEPFVMQLAASAEGVHAYDGASTDGAYTARCVAIVREGIASWNEWCGEAGRNATFVVLDGIDPWLVEVGAEPGAVTLTRQPSDWTLVSNGCSDPMVSIMTAAEFGPSSAAGVWCAGTEALLTVATVLLQPGPADGGHALLSNGSEGWNLVDRGTSLDCAGYTDGIDRCALFATTGELAASLPIPPATLIAPQVDAVTLRDATEEMRALAGAASDVGAITDAIVAGLTPDTDEVSPVITFAPDPGGWGVDALAVDVSQLDDSIRSVVHVVWISQPVDDRPASVVRAFAWGVCARGTAEPDLCV